MLSIFEYFFSGKSRLKKELAEARKELSNLSDNLVKWEGDELELMSLIQDERKVRSAFSSSVEGIICSIYHEHMVSYLWKKIPSIGDLSIITASTAKFNLDYIVKGELCSIYINNQYLGDLKKDNNLYLNKRRVLANIKVNSAEWWAVQIQNQYVGSLVNLEKARHVNPRAFQLQRGLSDEQEMVFLAIALYKIIDYTRRMKKIPFE